MALRSGGAVRSRVLRAESLPFVDRLLAQRLRRVAGQCPAAASAAWRSAADETGFQARAMAQPDAGRSLADERACGRDDSLLGGGASGGHGSAWAIMASAVANGARHRTRRGIGVVLSDSCGLRNTMDQYRRGAVAGRTPA